MCRSCRTDSRTGRIAAAVAVVAQVVRDHESYRQLDQVRSIAVDVPHPDRPRLDRDGRREREVDPPPCFSGRDRHLIRHPEQRPGIPTGLAYITARTGLRPRPRPHPRHVARQLEYVRGLRRGELRHLLVVHSRPDPSTSPGVVVPKVERPARQDGDRDRRAGRRRAVVVRDLEHARCRCRRSSR